MERLINLSFNLAFRAHNKPNNVWRKLHYHNRLRSPTIINLLSDFKSIKTYHEITFSLLHSPSKISPSIKSHTRGSSRRILKRLYNTAKIINSYLPPEHQINVSTSNIGKVLQLKKRRKKLKTHDPNSFPHAPLPLPLNSPKVPAI